ncbi:MAG: nitroreductase family deazaflavin-dependent oxidoreductase [Anaerolineae bacterium]|nr:nitroreductase family deazaflavin-dependent oxidoreductase [Anaerolineae bacterium]
MRLFTALPFGPFALVEHTGRKSGKTYRTPVVTARQPGGFLFALTYGDHVDWYRNILAAGHCRLHWRRRDYALVDPQPLPASQAVPSFPAPFNRVLRWMRLEDFFTLQEES